MGFEFIFYFYCFLLLGYFVGDDDVCVLVFLEMVNDFLVDVVWFVKGGYGLVCLLDKIMFYFELYVWEKIYFGYSDVGVIFVVFYSVGFEYVVYGFMLMDFNCIDG